MKHTNFAPLVYTTAILAFVTGGCARLDYKKVPTPTQYDNWNDEHQKLADSMKGVRYYLPRPFLHLKLSTPVAQRVALVSFALKDGKYELELPQDAPIWLKRAAPRQISITQALAASLATEARSGTDVNQQSGTAGGQTDAIPAEPSGGPNTIPGTNRPPSELHARTGFINEKDAITRLGERMDIVYLPDFEEQYVITPRIGLGTADIETRLRNGWAAEVFSQKVDNSNLIPYVIDQVERASEAAAGIFTTWAPVAAGLPPGTSPASVSEIVEQSVKAGGAQGDAKNVLGEVLIFKIAEVKIAQPGVYPILKPREIMHWLKFDGILDANDPDANLESLLNNAQTPWIRPEMAFIPCPPFTMIGFNVTTDVFLSPATERVVVAAPNRAERDSRANARGQTITIEEAIAQIKTKLEGAQASLDTSLAAIVNWDDIGVSTLGDTTTIELDLSSKIEDANKASALDELKKWSDSLFSVKPTDVKVTNPETSSAFPAPAKAILTFAYGAEILASRIKP